MSLRPGSGFSIRGRWLSCRWRRLTKAGFGIVRKIGVEHAAFSKRRGLKEEDMTPSPWVFDRLRRFRAGVEAGISRLKRCLGRCRWRGLPRFRAWVHSAVFAHNLVRIARLRPG